MKSAGSDLTWSSPGKPAPAGAGKPGVPSSTLCGRSPEQEPPDKVGGARAGGSAALGRRERAALSALLSWFVLISFLPDVLWPARKCYFAVTTESFQAFTVLHPVPWGSWHSLGGSGQENSSLPYMALLRLAYAAVPDRLLSLRLTSVLSAVLTLYFFYRTARLLFSPAVGLLFLFLLTTSPIYLESMRAFGYQSLSHLAVALVCWLLASSLDRRRPALKMAALAAAATATLSLYIAVRVAVALPVLFFLAYFRTAWRRLLLYLCFFIGLVVLLEAIWGGPLFNFSFYFYNPPEPGAEWVIDQGRFSPPMLRDHLLANLRSAGGYLLNHDRIPFADREPRSRLFSPWYTPFLLLGFLLCLRARGKGSTLVLIQFLLFFLAPLASSALQPRRVLLSLYPLNLTIALGLWLCYVRLRRVLPALGFVLFLIASGGGDLHEYLFAVTKPQLSFSREQLRSVSGVLSPLRRQVDWIRFSKAINEVVLGNPFFVPRPSAESRAAHLFGEEKIDLRWDITHFMPVGARLLYLYTVPEPPPVGSALSFAREKLPGLYSELAVPETPLRGILIRWDTIAPNVLSRPGTERTVSSTNLTVVNRPLREYNNEDVHFALIDLDSATSWDISLARGRGPGWVMFDHGEGKSSSVRSVSIRPAPGKFDLFFRTAELMGSTDGVGWERLARLAVGEAPRSGDWINWSFPNAGSYRYYRLFISPRNWSAQTDVISLGDILMFDAERRDFLIEELL